MQEEHRELYRFGLSVPYVQCESRGLYCLATKGACSRGVQAGCERGLSPKSRLCGVDRVVLATLERVCVLSCLVFLRCERVLDVCSGSSFIATRGRRAFTCFDSWSTSSKWWSNSSDPMEVCPSHPWGMADSMVAPVKGCRALLRSCRSGRWYCSVSCNSRKRQPQWRGLMSSIPLFYCEAVPHNERGKTI